MPHGSFAKKKNHTPWLRYLNTWSLVAGSVSGSHVAFVEDRRGGVVTSPYFQLTLPFSAPCLLLQMWPLRFLCQSLCLPAAMPPAMVAFFTLKSEAQINSSLHKLLLVTVFLTQQQ